MLDFEPEGKNYERLLARLSGQGLSALVDVLEAAALERDGPAALSVNPMHPGDHRIADEGLTVAGLTIDGALDRLGRPRGAGVGSSRPFRRVG